MKLREIEKFPPSQRGTPYAMTVTIMVVHVSHNAKFTGEILSKCIKNNGKFSFENFIRGDLSEVEHAFPKILILKKTTFCEWILKILDVLKSIWIQLSNA